MKSILSADFKLRELILESKVNNKWAVQVQENVNTLFLSYFKSWVNQEAVAKEFLTELNGFDFLLDRLFSKQESSKDETMDDDESLDEDGKSEEEEAEDEHILH